MSQEQQLRLLAIFHYVVGGLTALFACFPLIHLAIGLAMVFWPQTLSDPTNHPPPMILGWMFIAIGGAMFFFGQALAACIIITGRFITRRKRYLFIFIVACCECMIMPFGTVLGVFTIILLSKESVKVLFNPSSTSPVTTPV